MTERVRYEDWRRHRRSLTRQVLLAAEPGLTPHRRHRSRTVEERAVLVRAALDAIRRREESGGLVWTSLRSAVLRQRASPS